MNPLLLEISQADLGSYIRAQGWVQDSAAYQKGLMLFNHPVLAPAQLLYPQNRTADDYGEALASVIRKLSRLNAKSEVEIIGDIARVDDDTFRFRMFKGFDESAIPLSLALSAIKGAEQAFLSAACTVHNPRTHHLRMRKTALHTQFFDDAKFNHTERGSFILNISCPVKVTSEDPVTNLFGTEHDEKVTMARRTTAALFEGINELVKAVDSGKESQLVQDSMVSEQPVVSSNLAASLQYFTDPRIRNDFEMKVEWAPSMLYKNMRNSSVIVPHEYFATIRRIGEALVPNREEESQLYVGTVETLDGEWTEGARDGDVILSLKDWDSEEEITAKAYLSKEDYLIAVQAHLTKDAKIQIRGKLRPGNRPRLLEGAHDFRIFDVELK